MEHWGKGRGRQRRKGGVSGGGWNIGERGG